MEKFLPGGKIDMGKIMPGVCLSRCPFLTLHRSTFTFCANLKMLAYRVDYVNYLSMYDKFFFVYNSFTFSCQDIIKTLWFSSLIGYNSIWVIPIMKIC